MYMNNTAATNTNDDINNTNLNMLSPTNMMNTLSLNSDDFNKSSNRSVKRLSLVDITVAEILQTYKHDTDLLKHILAAKTEEDKRKTAEELRRAEEARLQSKYIDLQLEQTCKTSVLDDASLGLSPNNDWLSQVHSSGDLLSPSFLHNTNTPPSPYTLFDVPIADLNLSAPSSPEPNNPPVLLIEKISLTDDPPPPTPTSNNSNQPQEVNVPPPPAPNAPIVREKASCKRTFSRTRSTRKPSVRVLAKKNRYIQRSSSSNSNNKDEETIMTTTTTTEIQDNKGDEFDIGEKTGDGTLDHDKVMEALRAKLKRSSQQSKEPKREEITSMSPSGILLLDLKNPKKSFPLRPRASVVRKPNSFISAHKPKEANVNN